MQIRGGRGVTGQSLKDDDEVVMLIPARTLHTVLFFTDRGKVYSEKVYQLPDSGRTDRGIPVVNVLSLDPGEAITAAVSVPDFESATYLTMATEKGRVKRTQLSEFSSVRPSGLIAIGLEEKDRLCWVHLTKGKDDLLLITANGQALRFGETSIRPMGRPAAGVMGISLRGGDRVASMEVVQPGSDLLVVTERGYGKRTPLSEYPLKGRATGGVITIALHHMDTIGRIAVARVVHEEDEVTVISSSGIMIRMKVKGIAVMGRATRGVRLMDLGKGDSVASLARIAFSEIKVDIEPDGANNNGDTGSNGASPALPEAS
jgi:DNA gyrase subunit A